MTRTLLSRSTAAGIAIFALAGCVVEHDHTYVPPPSEPRIEFDEMTNLGYACGGPLTSWTVTARETQDSGTAGCEQPVLFTNLAPNTSYTFDIQGYSGQRLCWQGSCTVPTSGYGTAFADCSGQIEHLCGM